MSIALIDSNNFYASCEQSIDPSILCRPLVVLSNNDGCIIARNAEAKNLGIAMGIPYFKVRNKLKKLQVEIRSSNYALYADISQRLMSILKDSCEEIEIYSIDEAFVRITPNSHLELKCWASQLREAIYQSLGLAISIGIGATKVQSKVANYLAKTTATHAGIFNMENISNKDIWLERVPIEKVWGIGRKSSHWCKIQGVHNARQLRDMPSNLLMKEMGITGIRIQRELKGENNLSLLVKSTPKKETCVSRSFAEPITRIEDLRQAIATHIIHASKKLRKQKQYACKLTIFTRTSLYTSRFYSQSATKNLLLPSNDSRTLLSSALELTEKIFHPNYLLIKSGVIMQDLISEEYLQLNLFSKSNPKELSKKECLMKNIDYLNARYGRNTIQWGASGINKNHNNSQQYLSALTTTRIQEIPIVYI